MGSPEPQIPNKSIIASISDQQSADFLDSPIFNYINNLSPIKPVKGPSEIQVFPVLNSPPPSKRSHTHQQPIHLKSPDCHNISFQEDNNTAGPSLEKSSLKSSENILTKMTDAVNQMETFDNEDDNVLASSTHVEKVQEEHELSHPKSVDNDGKSRSCLQSNICVNGASVDQPYDQPLVAQVGKSQLGKRRRLEFEVAQDSIVESDPHVQNSSNTAAISEVVESSVLQTTRGSTVNVSKPSGIGLHLNSIVNAMPLRYLSGGRKKLTSFSSQTQDNMQLPSISPNSNLVENVSATSEEYAHHTPYSNSESMKIVEYREQFDQGSLNSAQVEAYGRSNPKKKRKKTESSGDGCKFCNCKKTKCLKLYCDCFAAGIYCADSCSCQGCFNRPEYENTVLETRQQIESRDPLAFAPKIVPHSTKSPRSQMLDDGDQVTPLAARHKRGCNCKKSMCMKKYCECYQANVGCSEGCRCEGCQNTFGIKGAPSMAKETGMESVNENVSDSFDEKNLKVGPNRARSSLLELHKPHNLSPQTPSFQCSTHGNDASEARVYPGRYVTSPESECPPYMTTTPKSPNNSVKMDQESYPDGEFMDEFSPGDWSTSRAQYLPPTRMRFSPLGFHGSSVTLFSGAKPSCNISDDDTPTILKDSAIQQHNKVKVASSSPNKKRVSPPRIRLHELGSSTLKSGRKFILKAVSSFPPLTPCIDSKQTSNHPPPDDTL
ncbi:putative transcription factor Tesmin family [Helianthus annuus]|nr:putative transcription factor Tesmin family [Helianthus annuus]